MDELMTQSTEQQVSIDNLLIIGQMKIIINENRSALSERSKT